ncbi:MAG: hypothetical protein K2O75_06725 [Lactobacillus sp.]|uniref:hypothetical protein n=1 Tax=Lactobacillus sp. TaxID=1591 RepID=UPI0023CB4EAB|nr:hypothetical protein [Lactobacillus sp.]MDE7050545.1 hypothetical protein [Lactobacillus sp.]
MKANSYIKNLLDEHKKLKEQVSKTYQRNGQKYQNLSLDFEKAKQKYNNRN